MLKLRGEAWSLRAMVHGKRRDFKLGIYGGEANRKKAEQAARKMLAELRQTAATTSMMDRMGLRAPEPVVAPTVPTLADWWRTYERIYSVKKADPGQDAYVMGVWMDFPRGAVTWGDTRMDAFQEIDCLAGLALRRTHKWKVRKNPANNTMSEGSIRREYGFMRAVFERAIDNKIIAYNPWRAIKKGKDSPRIRLLTPENEIKLLVELSQPTHQRFTRFLLQTGVRLGGAAGLRPEDLHGEYAHVSEKSPHHENTCRVCGRKGRKCREVWLTTEGRAIIKEQADAEGVLWAGIENTAWHTMDEAAKRAGIPHVSPHDMRHTFATRWLNSGGDLHTLSLILGHSSIAVTAEFYANFTKEDIAVKMRKVLEPDVVVSAAEVTA